MINCPEDCNKYHTKVKNLNGFDIYDCSICDHRFAKIDKVPQHVIRNYGDAYFLEGKNGGYPNYLAESDILIQRGQKYSNILKKQNIKEGKLLDVGAAAGFILKGFISEGWEGEGIEPNKTMAKYAKTQLGLNVSQSSLEEFESENKFDCITLIQVAAHFYDLDLVVKKLNNLLNDGKYLLIETWNRNSITAKFMGWNWHEYSPPTVIHWFSIDSLVKIFQQNNFTLIKKGRLLKKINVEHALSLLSEKFNSAIIRKMAKLIPNKLNVLYPSEDLFYIILKKKN